jgi:hypothetical protein
MRPSDRRNAVELHENLKAITAWRATLPERERRRLIGAQANVKRWRKETRHGNGKCPTDLKRRGQGRMEKIQGVPAITAGARGRPAVGGRRKRGCGPCIRSTKLRLTIRSAIKRHMWEKLPRRSRLLQTSHHSGSRRRVSSVHASGSVARSIKFIGTGCLLGRTASERPANMAAQHNKHRGNGFDVSASHARWVIGQRKSIGGGHT